MIKLNEIKKLSEIEFLDDVHKQDSAKYNLIVGIEALNDYSEELGSGAIVIALSSKFRVRKP